jgi:RNA polymerase sigma-70 factor (ECF subfamily)
LARETPPQANEGEAVRATVRAIRRGHSDAYAQIVERYQRRLFGLVLMMVKDAGGAEDVVQEAFLRAYTHLDRFDEQRDFYPWLATIAVRMAQNWMSRRSRVRAREGGSETEEADAGGTEDLVAELVDDERGRQLWRLVGALPQGERMAVLLYYRHDMQISDIANALGVTGGTVKTLLFRGRRKLRTMITDGEEERA